MKFYMWITVGYKQQQTMSAIYTECGEISDKHERCTELIYLRSFKNR